MTVQKSPLGQYFTPPHVASIMVNLLRAKQTEWILEPSAGTGIFVTALKQNSFLNICAVEIDSSLVNYTSTEMHICSFVSWQPTQRFEAVIGNPPYIRWKNLDQEQRTEIMQSVHWNELFNSLSDYMTVFVVNSIKALRDDGELVFITPSFWFHTQHAQQLRDFLLRNGHFTEIITFGESQVFENVSSSILIFRFVKSKKSATKINHYRFIGGRKVPSNLDLKNKAQFTLESIPHFQSGRHWTLSSEERQVVLQKFEEWTENKFNKDSELFRSRLYPTLGEYVDIANGMVSGLDRAFRVTPELQQQLNTAELRAIRPVTKGADLARLAKIGTSLYIDIPPGLSEMQVKKTFPNLFQHLSQFRETLEKRYSYGRKLPFWEWAFRRSESFFLNPKTKVFVPCKERLTNKSHVRFSLITDGSVATQDVTAIAPRTSTREAIEYIVAFLTLDEVTAWIREKGLMKGGVAEFSERPLTSIPFRPIDWTSTVEQEAHSQIVTTVKQSNIFNQTEKLQIIREIFELSLGLSTA